MLFLWTDGVNLSGFCFTYKYLELSFMEKGGGDRRKKDRYFRILFCLRLGFHGTLLLLSEI